MLRWLALTVVYAVLGAVALIALALVGVNLPPVSRVVAREVTRALEPMFKGRVVLQQLGHIDFGGVLGAEAEVLDAAGQSVLAAEGVDVRVFWPRVLWDSLTAGAEPLTIRLDEIGIERVRLRLIDDGTGTPTLASAFEPRVPEPKTPEEGPGTGIVLERVRIGEVEARGELSGLGPVDADLRQIEAKVENTAAGTHVALERLELAARQLPIVDTLSGTLNAEVVLPPSSSPDSLTEAEPSARADTPTTTVQALRPEPLRRIVASFAGHVAGSGASVDLRMAGQELRATLEAPELSPATVARLAPGVSARAPLALSTTLEGALEDLGFQARVTQDRAEVTARGRVRRAGEDTRLKARLDVSRLNLGQLLEGTPPTDISLGADAAVKLGVRGGSGSYELVTAPSRIGEQRLPVAKLKGELSMPDDRPLSTQGTLDIQEPGAPTLIDYSVESRESGARLRFSSATRLSRPARLEELSGGLLATGTVNTSGELDSGSERLDVSLDVNLSEVQHPQARAQSVRARGRARGLLALPELDVQAQARGISVADREIAALDVTARGSPRELRVSAVATGTDPRRVTLHTTVELSPDLQLNASDMVIDGERCSVSVTSDRISLAGGELRVDNLKLLGRPGRAEVSLAYGERLERLSLRTVGLNPAPLLAMFGVRTPLREANIDLEAELSNQGRFPRGKLELDVSDLTAVKLRDGRAQASFVLEGGKLSGEANVELARGAKTRLSVKDMKAPFDGAALTEPGRLSGELSLVGQLNLGELSALVPLPRLERADGVVRFDLAFEHPDGSDGPEWRAHVETSSLIIVEERPDVPQSESAERARQTAPLWLRGVDVKLDASLRRGELALSGNVFDRNGDLVRAEAKWQKISGVRDFGKLSEAVLRAPWNARVEVPPRHFEAFPAAVRPTEIEGIVSLGVEAEGSIDKPRVRARGRVERFTPAGELRRAPEIDLELGAEYSSRGGSLSLRAHDRRRPLLDLTSRWSGDLALASDARGGDSPINGDVRLELDGFPLEVVPELENRHVRGKLSGTIRLDGLGRDARFGLDLTARELRVDRLAIGQLTALAQTKGDQLSVRAELGGGGDVQAEFVTGLAWGARMVPLLEDRVEGRVRAQEFRLSALLPLIQGTVSEIDGKLSADLRAAFEGGAPQLSGSVSLREGVLHIPTVGQRFHDMTADVAVSPDTIRVSRIAARGVTGGFEANASADLEGLAPTRAELEVRIDEDDKLPLTIEGEAVGDGWGRVTATYQRDDVNKTNTMRVRLDEFNVELPRAPPKGIQDLAQPEHIRVGYHRRDGEFVPVPLQPLEEPGEPSEYQTIVVVELGKVRVEKGQQAEVALGGQIQATIGEKLDVNGKIETRRGELDISGKQFEIERGTVTFTGGAPDDPMISAVARYDSPAGYTVYAEYTGTVTQGKLRLSSEPALSQDEILTLLLFGSPDGSFGAGSGDSLTTAVSVAGGTAAQGLNRAISDLTDLDVSARIDTSTGAPRPELVLQLTPRVAARVTQAIGDPAPGQSPDRTFLTIELRLASAWSLSTMIGDRGASALDLIWRRRY